MEVLGSFVVMLFWFCASAAINMFNVFASGKITTQNVLFATRALAIKSRFKSYHLPDFGWLWNWEFWLITSGKV